MNDYMGNRPKKKVFEDSVVTELKNKAVEELTSKLLPDDKISKIILIGSSVKGSFGEYEQPGFRGSLYSDFDFIVFVEDNYEIPNWLNREPDGKPFLDDKLNLAYRNKKFVDGKYDIEVFFIKKSNLNNSDFKNQGELAGIPLTNESKHEYLVVYEESMV